MKSAILSYWKVKTEEDCAAKSTLRFLTWPEYKRLPFTDTHDVWRHIDPNTRDVRRAIVKARLLTGTYLIQSNRVRFNGSSVSDICLLCITEPEDTLYFVLCCPQLELRRHPYITEIYKQCPALCSLQPPELVTSQVLFTTPLYQCLNLFRESSCLRCIHKERQFSKRLRDGCSH